MTDRLHTTTATVYRAPVEGATWRVNRQEALLDWARLIVREAPCRGERCGKRRQGIYAAYHYCERHGSVWAEEDGGPIAQRLARRLGWMEGRR